MATKKYPVELKERGVRLVQEARRIDPNDRSAISRIARQLGVGAESLRTWIKQAEIDAGKAPGMDGRYIPTKTQLREELFRKMPAP